jgi:hypothetical protein
MTTMGCMLLFLVSGLFAITTAAMAGESKGVQRVLLAIICVVAIVTMAASVFYLR